MNKEDRDPMEQIDYGGNYRAFQSPQQTMNLKVEGGTVAIAIALLALGGVLVAAILIPDLIDSRAKAESAPALVRSQAAYTEARLAVDDIEDIRRALAAHNINVEE